MTAAGDRVAQLTRLLVELRREGRQLDQVDETLVPASLDEAYAVQAEVARQVPGGTCGWKIGMTSEAAMRMRGLSHPVYARLFKASTLFGSGQLKGGGGRLMFEAEYVFELMCDLPAGDYSRDELIESVRVRPGIEVCGSRFSTQEPLNLFLSLADNSFHLGLVLGAPLDGWETCYLDEGVTIVGDDGQEVSGSAREVLGDPLAGLKWLASLSLPDGGLKGGHFVASGVAAKLDVVKLPAAAHASFGGRRPISAELL